MTQADRTEDPRCTCPAELNSSCPVHGNHPSNIEPREEGELPYRPWSEYED